MLITPVVSSFCIAPHKNLQLLVSLDSELLTMQEKPSERNSTFLFHTVSGRPESGAQVQQSDFDATASENNRNRINNNRRATRGIVGVNGGHISKKPSKSERKASQQTQQELPTHSTSHKSSNQESPSKQQIKRIAWDSPTAVGTAVASPFSYRAPFGQHASKNVGSIDSHSRQGNTTRASVAELQSQHKTNDAASMASPISSQQTPSRLFKMERFRVITPAFVSSSLQRDPRLTPLPMIHPTRDTRSSEAAGGAESSTGGDATPKAEEDDARIENAASLLPTPAAALLNPKHMLEVFQTKQMPLASPAFFKRHLRDDSGCEGSSKEGSRAPPSRLQVLEWSEWKQKGLTEETAAAEYGNLNLVRPSNSLTSRLPVRPGSSRKRSLAKRVAIPSLTSALTPSSSNSVPEERLKDLNTPEYKQKRLRDILSTPVEPSEANAAQLRSLAKRVNTSFMVSLGAEIDELRREEMAVRSEMHTLIQAERDQLPLKFLFQLPGGAAYCRHRMRRAMALWVLEFEDNQRRMALMQWKAFVEHYRFQIRGKEYQRQAARKRLRVAIDYVLRGYLTQALTKWVETTQVLIWTDRDHAARKIQVHVRRNFGKLRFLWLHDSAPIGSLILRDMYLAPCRNLRFQIPPRVREERRQIWSAAELVQSAYRRRRFRVSLARYRAAAAKIQAQQRMRAARSRYRALLRRIIVFQAYIRMLKHFHTYQKLRIAVLLVQTTFRSVRVRRLRRLVICAQRRKQELFLSRVLLAQRLIRGFLGRRTARSIRRFREEQFNAALVVQRCWYRRNNEWSTFLLLGCLRMKESEEIAFATKVLAYKRNYMARQIRRAWLAYIIAKKNAAALMIQCNYRRHIAQRAVQRIRKRKMAHRRIKWFFLVHHAKRIRMATFLQFWWLRAARGRLAHHLRQKRLIEERNAARALYFREARAAARMQALIRSHNDRIVARRERSARKIQRAIREFLLWRRIKHELTRIKMAFARQAVTEYITAGFDKVYSAKMKVCNFAATQIQRFYRGTRWRSVQMQAIVSEELRTRMAIRVQSLWRFNAHRRMAKNLLQAQKRKLTNPFCEYDSLTVILHEMLRRSCAYFDPDDDLKGMAIPTWLRRLGLESKYLEFFQKSHLLLANGTDGGGSDISLPSLVAALTKLQKMDPDSCRKQLETIGIEDEDDLELMVTNLFARQTIKETQQLRDRIASAHTRQVALKRTCDLALMNLQKLETTTRDAETVLEEVLDEMKDFRNPPNALRKRREMCGKELEDALKAVSGAQRKCEALKKQFAEKAHELALQQQHLTDLQEPKEISALYSQRSLKLVSDMNSIREMFLARFPGLEARALTFVNALDPDQVTTWQLEKFFQTHTSVSAVKANMKELTYFGLETEMKKLDHTRFSQCTDILQHGYECMCDLLGIPMEIVVLGKREGHAESSVACGEMIHQELLDTIWLVRKASKVNERAKVWRHGLDTLMQMNKTAVGVQSMWRHRAAKKLMAIVRNRRGRERILQEYIAEVGIDHVTPLWEADRKKEQEELDDWLDQEVLAERLDVLHEVVRFPYIEEWDEDTQMYYYYYEDAMISDELEASNRQYAPEGKPVYTIEEEGATIVIQTAVRVFLARLEVLALQREQRRLVRRSALEREWNRTKDERSQTVTLQFRPNVAPNGRIMSWLKRRRKAARARQKADAVSNNSTISVKKTVNGKEKNKQNELKRRTSMKAKAGKAEVDSVENEADEVWNKQTDALVDNQLAAAYNRSVRAENRKDWTFPAHSRPQNVHGQAIIGLLNQFRQFESRTSPDTSTDANLRFTKVELRFGWKEVRATTGGFRPYYHNNFTDESSWERPEYTFDDECAATKMQSVVRMLVAKNVLASELDAISFIETVQKTVRSAGKIGWIGFGLEGISTPVYLSRFGLSKYSKELAKASVDDIATLSDVKLKRLAWTKEEIGLLKQTPVRIRKKCPLSSCEISLPPNTKHPFNFLSSERLVQQILSQSLPNQQGRVLGLVKAIRASTTPISFRQLEIHLRKFAGRPDEALSCIDEIANLEFATREPQEIEICRLYIRCIERCVVFAANLNLTALQRHLSTVLNVTTLLLPVEYATTFAFAIVATTPLSSLEDEEQERQEVERYKQAALARYPQKIVKGLWEQDASKQQASASDSTQQCFSVAQVAYYLREEALERVLRWVRSALLCQSTYRMHKVRQWYVATKAFRVHSATQIQCAWRVRCALEVKALLGSQQQSNYEQCYDKSSKSFFFVYTPTQEKLLDEPRDETDAIIPFRPMVQDRVTKRWVRCWPHYDKKKSRRKQTLGDGDDTANGPPCSICNAERAARRCNECYSATGDYIDFCLVCFYDRHVPDNVETSWHSYQTLHRMKAQFFHCVECRRFSSLRCLQCDENYCERCFQRVHGKGHKRTAHKCEMYDPMAQICVECEMRVAFQLCLVCQDALCEDCMARTHSKGARTTHDLKLIKQSVSEVQVFCEQCHARCGNARCEYCSRALCNVCLSDRHALICPETELNQKRQQLLGDKICVECGKAADRACESCGDRYCSVRWMGNPGCFERFHQKGKRADHTFTQFEAPAMTREIFELEEQVKRKRKQDAEDAEHEAKTLVAAMLALAGDDEQRKKQQQQQKKGRRNSGRKRPLKQSGSKSRLLAGGDDSQRRCCVETCESLGLGDGDGMRIAFCAKHFTLQHALEVTKQDPLEAAKLLAQIEKDGGKLVSPGAGSVLGSKLLWSLLRSESMGATGASDSDSKGAAKKKKALKKKKDAIG